MKKEQERLSRSQKKLAKLQEHVKRLQNKVAEDKKAADRAEKRKESLMKKKAGELLIDYIKGHPDAALSQEFFTIVDQLTNQNVKSLFDPLKKLKPEAKPKLVKEEFKEALSA